MAKSGDYNDYLKILCGWRDSNSQGVSHTPLKRARIPIPPHPHLSALPLYHTYLPDGKGLRGNIDTV